MATEAKRGPLTGIAMIAAVAVLIVWLGMLWWLILHTDAAEVTWARWLTVLASLEAVAFAAAGAIFGTTVQRERVAKAESRAAKAEDDAKGSAKEAANGRALAEAVKSRARAQPAPASAGGIERTSRSTGDAPQLDDLAQLAHRLFPD